MDGEKERIQVNNNFHILEDSQKRIRPMKRTTSNPPSQPAIGFAEVLDDLMPTGFAARHRGENSALMAGPVSG